MTVLPDSVTKNQSSQWQTIAAIPEQKFEQYLTETQDRVITKAGLLQLDRKAMWSGNSEWYTPAVYIEAAREVMGGIDLDPASCERAQEIVKAERYYTAKDDGLSMPWEGNVWLNPPYKQLALFMERLFKHHLDGRVPQAVALTNNNTDSQWFSQALHATGLVCFPEERIHFHNEEISSQPTNGQVFFYFGKRQDAFIAAFRKFGPILREV